MKMEKFLLPLFVVLFTFCSSVLLGQDLGQLKNQDVNTLSANQIETYWAQIKKGGYKRFGEDLTGLTFAIWGLAFKPGTDDMREAPAIYVIKELVKRGAKIKAYDPKAIEESKAFYLEDTANITYFESKYEVLKDTEALILLTEWKEFRSPDFEEIKRKLNFPIIFDGRNQYNAFNLEEKGFEYYQIGK